MNGKIKPFGDVTENMEYQETLDWLFGLENIGIKLGLGRVRELLQDLGNPQNKFRYVHVAGTNGKGSVCAMTASILQASGLRTGLYTSPHLVDFRERIMIDGVMIPEVDVVDLAREIHDIGDCYADADSRPLTFFEVTTAIAFLYFARKGVEVAVVEVGMGGRLDATNVILPDVCVITRISKEHVQYLGDTIAKIAYEKAGIIKPGVTVITAEDNDVVLKVLDSVARDKGTYLLRLGTDFDFQVIGNDRSGVTIQLSSIGRAAKLPLLGHYQAANAAMACEAALELRKRGLKVTEDSIVRGLSNVVWPGRLEVVQDNPLVIFDVSHTSEGARVAVEELLKIRQGHTTVVLGVLSDKDLEGIAKEFAKVSDSVIATMPKTKRAFSSEQVRDAMVRFCDDVSICDDVGESLRKALINSGNGDTVIVGGSLYTIGEAKWWWDCHEAH
ncbi:MAG: folylpolyglutamate synthase/dihydrofolate synthase family protein [Methanomassiliicoccales archaeon]|jgi:dihydrofolate synthase/folylpolyglutamate synthase